MKRHARPRLAVLTPTALLLAFAGCGDDGSGEGPDAGGQTRSCATQSAIEWEPCPFYTGGTGLAAECAVFEVPLDWSNPGGPQIELFVKRLGGGAGRIQLFMLFGGPGGSGVNYEDDAEVLLAHDSNLQIYLPDHRGTGRSSPLGDLADAQVRWGAGLSQFTTSNAARDVSWVIDRACDPDTSVHVYGASYGSYWTHRYLQLFADQANGATLLGIAAPGFSFNYYERDFNAAGVAFLSLCDGDPVCAARFGPNTVDRAWQILVDVSQGQCAAAGLNTTALRTYFATRVAWHWETRALIPAILHRLNRCNPADVVALQTAAPKILDPYDLSTEPPAWSVTLGNHIRFSELSDTPLPTDSELQTIHNSAFFTLGSNVGQADAYASWPRYIPDEYDGAYATTTTPMLMLHGELDPNAPLAQALPLRDRFNGPNQSFFIMPHGVHSWPSPYPGGDSCMRSLFLAFLNNPTAPLDDCSDDVLPMSFDRDDLAPEFFGTASLWDN